MRTGKLLIILTLFMYAFGNSSLSAQDGDQILDGIGETGLIARYVFDGDTKDWSRNNLHAVFTGGKAVFANDEKFGKVLVIPSEGKTFVKVPGESLINEESVSITGWVKLSAVESGQKILDLGKGSDAHFYLSPEGGGDKGGFQAVMITEGKKSFEINSEQQVKSDEWFHFTIVVDVPSKVFTTFINGEKIGKAEAMDIELSELFSGDGADNIIHFGNSIAGDGTPIAGNYHDFRIYRIPLNEKQVKRIYYKALRGGEGSVHVRERPADVLPQFPADNPQLYNEYLTGVADITVETEVGSLPRLPRLVPGTYKNGIKGPEVRVLWPAPADNATVLNPGTFVVTGTVSGTDLKPKATVIVKSGKAAKTPEENLEVFALDQVSLNVDQEGHNTKFIENRNKFIDTLATTNPDSFLYMFRNAFGQPQPEGAKPLGVWDSQETKLRGHATGHYLTAIAQAYASTGYDKALQAKFADKMDYMVNTLYDLSRLSGHPKDQGGVYVADPIAVPPGPGKDTYNSDLTESGIRTDYWNWGEGFISAYPPDQFIMLEKGATYGTDVSKIWAPYYTLHKILAGLMDIYEVSGNEKALEISKGMGDWVYARLSQVPTATLIEMWNRYIAGEFGGMNEAMARLYRITGEAKYLEVARLFDNIKVFFGDASHSHGLAKNVDLFRGLHANQHIPQIIGALEIYRDSDSPEYYHVADNFWYKAKNDYMYSIGGVAGARNPANAECFIGQPATLYENGFSEGGQNETCATYNMLKLTKNLFLFDQRPEYMDYYERGLYNHILASVAEDSPANTYHVPLRPGSVKHFGNPNMTGFTCCNGTALESSTKLQNSIYFKSNDDKALYVNLFIPSTLNWTEKNIVVEQETAFPKVDITNFTIHGKGKFDFKVRVPQWAKVGYTVKINGKEEKVNATPGSYVTLSRKWKDGDRIEIKMPFQFHLDPVMDQQNIASLFYGPILLVAQESEPRTDWRKITLDADDLGSTIKGDPKKLEFTIDGVVYKPFYETYGRHSVYLDVTLE
ncbi:beta-L-arabinofuranosidase domain-containing protein [Robertkochia solimangrovi]|uniref:beta-L-arabinofuranosidase domain-containing protein n=1 Tax=Robertkochia solimangrovi TaxID=2213046 RepID=UPI00117CF889|nr:beta-L-arabinofuranosidase domain-containing protein [Robertkochia solimangrovi]TRZ42934.1 hypothetical protein DMZ48_12780 [Robertkochia solimangrovi]